MGFAYSIASHGQLVHRILGNTFTARWEVTPGMKPQTPCRLDARSVGLAVHQCQSHHHSAVVQGTCLLAILCQLPDYPSQRCGNHRESLLRLNLLDSSQATGTPLMRFSQWDPLPAWGFHTQEVDSLVGTISHLLVVFTLLRTLASPLLQCVQRETG